MPSVPLSPAPPPPPPYAFVATPPPRPVEAPATPIAHWTHTLALFAVLLFTSLAGRAHAIGVLEQNQPHTMRYLSSILLEWLLLGSVIAGIYHRGPFLLNAFRSRAFAGMNSAAGVFALGVPVYFFGLISAGIAASLLYFTPLRGKTNEAVVLAMLPHTAPEYLLWLGVSLTAGITEEIIFRGYLLQQVTAWTRRPILAVILSALLFGSVHLYEGPAAILPLAALAIAYGLVVHFMRGDLRAVIVAHTLQDFMVPFLVHLRGFALNHQPHP